MAYLQLGLGTTSFNSTTYPGTCKPSDAATLAAFKNLQAQLNRVIQGYLNLNNTNPGAFDLGPLSLISVDGDVGPGTMQQFEQVQALLQADSAVSSTGAAGAAAAIIAQDTSSCSAVAANAESLAAFAQTAADLMGVPSKISQPSSGSSTLVSSSGKSTTVHTPTPANSGIATSLTDMVAGLDTTTLLMLAAGAGALIYFTGRPSKKTRARGKTSRRRRSSITIYR